MKMQIGVEPEDEDQGDEKRDLQDSTGYDRFYIGNF